mgnify:CR=1 FL=1
MVPHARALFISDFMGDIEAVRTALTKAADRGVRGVLLHVGDDRLDVVAVALVDYKDREFDSFETLEEMRSSIGSACSSSTERPIRRPPSCCSSSCSLFRADLLGFGWATG